jgi:hypothetical protein
MNLVYSRSLKSLNSFNIAQKSKTEIGKIMVGGQLGQIFLQDPHLQNNQKWTGGVAQVVECLLSKCKDLSSNLIPPKKKKKKRSKSNVRAF